MYYMAVFNVLGPQNSDPVHAHALGLTLTTYNICLSHMPRYIRRCFHSCWMVIHEDQMIMKGIGDLYKPLELTQQRNSSKVVKRHVSPAYQ